MTRVLLIVMVLVATALSALAGNGSRSVSPIMTPQRSAPAGAAAVSPANFQPVAVQVLQPKLAGILSRWNTPEMQRDLAASFRDSDRLVEAVNNVVPRDATVRLLSLRGVQTLQQYEKSAAGGEPARRVSIVSATASTQLEYQGNTGLVRLPGVNEFILEVTERLSR